MAVDGSEVDIRIAIGVPTYNRVSLVRLNAASLSNSALPGDVILLVVDDCSEDYGLEFLRACYPAATIVRRERNSGGADMAAFDLLSRLHATGRQWLLVLDSDLILASDWLERVRPFLPLTDGLLSLFNTANHAPISASGGLLQKNTIGMAGTLWRRDVAEEVLAAVPPGWGWDDRACTHVRSSGRRIFSVADSLAQHVGFAEGQNSHPHKGDIGMGFHDCDSRSLYLLMEGLMLQEQAANRSIAVRFGVIERALKPLLWINRKLAPVRRRIRAWRER